MRDIFRGYAAHCKYNISILTNCITDPIKSESMYGEGNFPCKLKSNKERGANYPPVAEVMYYTVKAGHIRYGMPGLETPGIVLFHLFFLATERQATLPTHFLCIKYLHILWYVDFKYIIFQTGVKSIYISWMRDPLEMLLSLTTYLMEKTTYKMVYLYLIILSSK